MSKKKEELREVPLKNYIILLFVCVLTIILTFYINAWIKTYRDSKLSISPLTGQVNEINLNEIDETVLEFPNAIIYVGYNNDKTIHNEEKKLAKIIKEEENEVPVIYLNVTGYDNYVNVINKKFSDSKEEINKAPAFIYVSEGTAEKIISVKDEKKLGKEFKRIISLYEE